MLNKKKKYKHKKHFMTHETNDGSKWLSRKNTEQLYKCTNKNKNNIKTEQTATHLIKNVITHAFQQPQCSKR